MKQIVNDCIDAAHPALPGHFPGEPIVPGVVLLNRVAAAYATLHPHPVTGWTLVKFLAPLRPGVAFAIEFDAAADTAAGTVKFAVRTAQTLIASGSFTHGAR